MATATENNGKNELARRLYIMVLFYHKHASRAMRTFRENLLRVFAIQRLARHRQPLDAAINASASAAEAGAVVAAVEAEAGAGADGASRDGDDGGGGDDQQSQPSCVRQDPEA